MSKDLKVILTRGLPASGKSTWSQEWVEKNPKWKRVNKDLLRECLDFSKWSKDNEAFILVARDNLIRAALEAGYSVIVDDTNFSDKHKNRIEALVKQLAADTGKTITVEEKDFTDVPVQECLKRDRLRAKPVGDKVIISMYNQYLSQRPCTALQDNRKPRAVCFDIDGTIASHEGIRGHYDHDRYIEDNVIHAVAKHLTFYTYEGTKVIIVTARDEDGRSQTEAWLKKHDLPYDALIMRAAGDPRPDYVAKKEMLTKLMETYFIEACYEDRLRNVNMMREELGLTVFHTDHGIF
jgi:predicted kinase